MTIMGKTAKNVFSRINWKIYRPTWFSIITLLLVLPCEFFLPEKYAWENGIIENVQLLIIAICFVLALSVKNNKDLFRWIALVCIILFLREINCGRIFFPNVNQEENSAPTFMKWFEILPELYCKVPNIIYAGIIIWTLVYFFYTNAYKQLLYSVIKRKIDGINFTCLFIGICFGILAENKLHNEMLEETTETLFYVSFTVLVYLYGYNKEYKFSKESI